MKRYLESSSMPVAPGMLEQLETGSSFADLYDEALLSRNREALELLDSVALTDTRAPELSRPETSSPVEVVVEEEAIEVGDFSLIRH